MNEETTAQPEISLELFHPKKAELVGLAAQYKDLTIAGIDDKDGYKAVHDARMVLVKARTGINATRKEYTKQFDEAKARAMALEKELLGVIAPVEESLLKQEEAIDAEKERIKKEKELEEQMKINSRVEKLAAYGHTHDIFDLRMMEDARFEEILSEKKAAWEAAEKARLDKEEADRKEREDFEKKKAEQEAKEKEIADREAAIAAKEKAAEDEQLAKDRAAEMEKQRKEAADQAVKDTEARMKKEQEEKERQEAEDRKNKKMAEEFEQKQLEKKKKYQAWLADNKATDADMIRKTEDGKKIILWRVVSEFTL